MGKLEALVAPIALYPDPLLAQTLAASTYPLEIVQLQQWLAKHPDLKDKALVDSVARQPWDSSVQSMAAVPEVVKRLADDVQWTTDLGNAFLAQPDDVMTAVQTMRKKAEGNGALESSEQMTVEVTVVEKDTVIIIQPTKTEVIYVPSYSPTVVYGPPPVYYPYPPIYYPPYPPGGMFISFSMGVMWGAAWGGSCCHCGWGGGGNNIYINNSNNFNQINHNVNRGGGGNSGWQHNPQHRGGTPYPNQNTASKYGGSTRGGASAGNRAAGGAARAGSPSVSNRASGGAANRAASPSVSNRASGGGSANRAGSSSSQIGNRSVPKSSNTRSSGFSGGSRGYSGSSARSSSSRGASSMGGRGGGGRRG
jgi:hypothetical protein